MNSARIHSRSGVRMRSLALSLTCLLWLAPVRAGNVHIVGGTGSTAATIQAAVTAASDGDVILVRTSPVAGFVLTNKDLTVVGEVAGATIDGNVLVQGMS